MSMSTRRLSHTSVNSPPLVVAEINSSHFGDLSLAKRMISALASLGCDVVKFQSWSPESLYTKKYLSENPVAARMFRKFSLSNEQMKELAAYSFDHGIGFSSTSYTEREVDLLASLEAVPFVKIASMDLNNVSLIRYAASVGKPLVLSTGMADFDEIVDAVTSAKSAPETTLLHCTSLYPTPIELANVSGVSWLAKSFPECKIGFSDHTTNSTAAIGAVALGARLLEKHVTTDKSRPGFDNAMALSLEEFGSYLGQVREAASSLGSQTRALSEAEIDQRKKLRRSIFAARDIRTGETFLPELVIFKRPGDGLSVNQVDKLLGCRFRCNVAEGDYIRMEDLE